MVCAGEPWVDLSCACGARERTAPPGDTSLPIRCSCGAELGIWRHGLAEIGPAAPYWGEVPAAQLARLVAEAQRGDWRAAAARWLPADLNRYITHPDRAAFADLLPLPAGARILEIGAGLGGISARLAQRYTVVALEGVAERAAFLALRARQDGLRRLIALRNDFHHLAFAPGQFDAVLLNGILEWVPVGDLSAPPRAVQLRFLRTARTWLAPGGMIYLAIENRFGLPQWRGAVDHSGLRYTSLLPRPLARLACRRARGPYRSGGNQGYRTYTYSRWGYERLFRAAGLRPRHTYLCPRGYNLPVDIIPLEREALAFRARHQPWQANRPLRAWWHRRLGTPWFWGAVGGDLAFVLEPRPEAATACTS